MKKSEIRSLSDADIWRIADEIDSGFRCYWNFTNNDLVFIPDPDRFPDMEELGEDGWDEDIKQVKKNKKNYLLIECLSSHESFEIMRDFVVNLEEGNPLLPLLIAALGERKPFSKFKFVIDNSGEYREKWFAFKHQWMMNYVREQIENWKDRKHS